MEGHPLITHLCSVLFYEHHFTWYFERARVKCEKTGRDAPICNSKMVVICYSQLYRLLITTINYIPHKQTCIVPPLSIRYDYCELQRCSLLFNNGTAKAARARVCTALKKGTFTVHASGAMKHRTCLQLLSCPAATANTCSSPFFVTLSRSQDRRIIVQPLRFQPLLLAPPFSPPVLPHRIFSSPTAGIVPSLCCVVLCSLFAIIAAFYILENICPLTSASNFPFVRIVAHSRTDFHRGDASARDK